MADREDRVEPEWRVEEKANDESADPDPESGGSLAGEPASQHPFPGLIVGVGASAGGLEAFSELLRNLPATTGMAFVLVQHLDPRHESILAELLGNWTAMPVIQVQHDVQVQPDHVYVIPPNATMLLTDGVLRLNPLVEGPSRQRKPIDAFFASLAESMRSRAVGVVLSGAASDGTLGLKAIKAEGGITFAQDASAKFDGMPQSAIAAGFVDFVLPPQRIGQELATIARHPLSARAPERLLGDLSTLDKIVALLRRQTRVDFGQYKAPTVQRRLARRMLMQGVATLEEYLDLLKSEPREVEALFEDLLIKVTEFFRDAPAFEALKETALPAIMKARPQAESLRVWIPGCSTGEEVYSLAISLIEYMEQARLSLNVKIFGTDVSESVVEKARKGTYHDSGVSTLSPDRLGRFFGKCWGRTRLSPTWT